MKQEKIEKIEKNLKEKTIEIRLNCPSKEVKDEPDLRTSIYGAKMDVRLSKDSVRALEIYRNAVRGFQDFRKYLSSNGVLISDPGLNYMNIEKKENAFHPVLGSFVENPNIFAGVVGDIGIIENVKVTKDFDSLSCSISGKLTSNHKTIRTREYEYNDGDVFIKRYPFLISSSGNAVERYAGLSFEVFLNELEDITTKRIKERINLFKDGFNSRDLAMILSVSLYEECLIPIGIIKNFLYKTHDKTGFDFKEIEKFNPYEIHPEDVSLSRLQTMRVGARKIFDFYKSRNWDAERYLRGEF